MSEEISLRIVFDGIAKPNPCESLTIAVVMPTTLPSEFKSNPPELPGFIGVLVWITFAIA
jgi:hypothetical protein